MPLALPILILLIAVVIMLIIRLLRAEFAYHWLVATVGSFTALPMMFFIGTQLPQTDSLIAWKPENLFPSPLTLTADQISWPFAVGLITLVVAMMLTEVARAAEARWSAWAAGLLLGALGVWAILAGNPLTLLVAWTAIDLVDFLLLFSQKVPSEMRERVVVAFTVRILGSGMLLAAILLNSTEGFDWTFTAIPSQATTLLLVAVGMRLGVLPAYMPMIRESVSRRGLGSMIYLVSAAGCLVLLNRTAYFVESPTSFTLLLVFVSLSAIYAGLSWVLAGDELEGAPAWILGMSSLSAAATMLAQPVASQAWGMAVLLAGGLIFYTSVLERRMVWLPLLGLLGISALPFTPTWNGALMYAPPYNIILIIFILTQVLFMYGYIKHALRTREGLTGVERWVWLIYPLGLALLPILHFIYGWTTLVEFENLLPASWWLGIVAAMLTALLVGITRFVPEISLERVAFLHSLFSMKWLYRLIWVVIRTVEGVIQFSTTILQGEGGVLWAFLMLLVLILVFVALLGGI